jgi:hypothetical protein
VKLRPSLLLSMVLALCLAPTAAARTAHAQGGIAAGIATELAKSGVKAGIAEFAPDLVKYTDPTAHGLAQIRDQLTALDGKVTQLKLHQEALEHHLNCVTQRTALNPVLSAAQTNLEELIAASRLATPEGRKLRLTQLSAHIGALAKDQHHLHLALAGDDGALRACAKHIEMGMRPFLTSELAPAVRDFYATYEAAAVSLLVVRVNLINFKASLDGSYSADEGVQAAQQVQGWIAQEEGLIKPAFPYTESYNVPEDLLFRTRVAPEGLTDYEAHSLWKQGWWASIRNAGPGCTQLARVFRSVGVTDSQVRGVLQRRNVVRMPRYVYCFDDHDGLYAYDFDLFRYESASHVHVYVDRNIGMVVSRRGQGFFDLKKYSYTL